MALQATTEPVDIEAGWVVAASGVKLFRIDKEGVWLYDKRRKTEICLTFAQVLRIIAVYIGD